MRVRDGKERDGGERRKEKEGWGRKGEGAGEERRDKY